MKRFIITEEEKQHIISLYEGTENAETKKIFETLKSLKSTKEINDFCFKRGKGWSFWSNFITKSEDDIYYVHFNSVGDTLSYSIN